MEETVGKTPSSQVSQGIEPNDAKAISLLVTVLQKSIWYELNTFMLQVLRTRHITDTAEQRGVG